MIFLLRKVPPSGPVFVRSSTGTWMGAGGERFETSIISICERNGRVSAILPEEPREARRDLWKQDFNEPANEWRTKNPVVRREWTTLSHFRRQVDAGNRVRKPLTEIENIPEPELRAARIAPYLKWTGEDHSHTVFMQREALDALSACGASAIPHLRNLLRDDAYQGSSRKDILRIMATNEPEEFAPVFVDILRADLEFWTGLEGVPDRSHSLVNRHLIGRELIRSLALMGLQESRETIQRTLKFWQSAPDLDKAISRSKMTDCCEAALKTLDTGAKIWPLENNDRSRTRRTRLRKR